MLSNPHPFLTLSIPPTVFTSISAPQRFCCSLCHWHSSQRGEDWHSSQRGEEQGSKSPFSLLSEPISPSSLLFISSSRSIQFNSPYSQLFFFSLLPTFSLYFYLFWAISPSSLLCSSPLFTGLRNFFHSIKRAKTLFF